MTRAVVSIETPDGAFSAYLCGPVAAKAPAILVVQEIFGVTPFVKGVCEWLARNGFVALAPDLFWRQQAGVVLEESDRETAGRFMRNLDEKATVADCKAALAYLRALPSCSGATAALGYCLGGKFAYLLMAEGSVDAAVSYYGVGIHDHLHRAAEISAPILLHIAANDPLCPRDAQARIVTALAEARGLATIEIHEDVGHAFARKGSVAFRASTAARADSITIDFLHEHLDKSIDR